MKRVSILALFLVLSLVTAVEAASPTPLPIVELIKLDGQIVRLADTYTDGQWLVIYIRPNCRACDTALGLIGATASTRLVVVGDMPVNDLKRVALEHPQMVGTTWLADTAHRVAGSLQLSGAPVALGIRRQTTLWTLNGLLGDREQYVATLRNWIK